jgi:glycosyltransferase involved in cell wall biosynthesis
MSDERPLVVLPTYNERENLSRVLAGIRARDTDVLIVDDNSPDGTGEMADSLSAADPGVHVLHRPRKLGLGSAYIAGFNFGLERGYGFLLEMDADGSHLPEYLPALIDAARRSGGMALGSRYVKGGDIVGWGPARKFLSSGANLYCRFVLHLPVHDCTSGFRCYRREVLEKINLAEIFSQGYSFQIELAYKCLQLGFPIIEVPIRFEDRVAGKSKVSEAEVRKALLTVLRLRFPDWKLLQPPEPAERLPTSGD